MKQVKLILLVAEVATLLSVICLAFSEVSEEAELFKSIYISLLSLLAVALQSEYQDISWNGSEEEELG